MLQVPITDKHFIPQRTPSDYIKRIQGTFYGGEEWQKSQCCGETKDKMLHSNNESEVEIYLIQGAFRHDYITTQDRT